MLLASGVLSECRTQWADEYRVGFVGRSKRGWRTRLIYGRAGFGAELQPLFLALLVWKALIRTTITTSPAISVGHIQ
jgi:hypothetical protein